MKFLLFIALIGAFYLLVRRGSVQRPTMRRADAARLLGIEDSADADAVAEAHRRLIARVHPDAGGSAVLAAQINEARDVMLKD